MHNKRKDLESELDGSPCIEAFFLGLLNAIYYNDFASMSSANNF